MRSFQRILWSVFAVSLCFAHPVDALTLSERLSGRILLQVQSHGEAWYIDPLTKTRFYLGTPTDAFQLLCLKGLGIRHAEFVRYQVSRFPSRLSGRILLDVDDYGKAYYILPTILRSVRLGNAQETYQVLRQQGLGITDSDLNHIAAATISPSLPPEETSPPSPSTDSSVDASVQRTFVLINDHRRSIGLLPLVWNPEVAEVARIHSQNMAAGHVAFGHDGSDQRFAELQTRMTISHMAENVAANTYPDAVATAVAGWLQSPGHRANIENGQYTQTGVWMAVASDGTVFFTQIFVSR